jgi:O-antigen/teichoic acid export membrane protein
MGQLRKVRLVKLENTQKMRASIKHMQNSQKIQATLVRLQNNQKVHVAGVNVKRIVNNTVISLIGQLVTWISTLLLTIAYGRFLGDFKFGELYFAITFVLLIGFPIESGFNQQLTRDVAVEPAKALRYLSNTLVIKVVLWLVLYVGIIFICRILGYNPEERTLVAVCGITLLGDSIANTFASLHYAFERVIYPAVGLILEKGLAALIGFLLLRSGASVEVMALVLLGGAFTNASWQAVWFFRRVGVGFTIEGALIRNLIRSSIPFLAYGVLGVIYYRLDTVILSLEASATVVGWYGAAYRLFDTLIFLPSLVISAIMYPVFSKLSATSEATLKTAVEKSTNFLLFCAIPITSMLIAAAPAIIAFLYHRQDFIPSIPALQGLAPGLVFLYVNSVFSAIIMSTKQEKKITIMAAIALVFNLTLNLILIPIYQHVGAAIVTSLTELLLLCIGLVFVPNRLLPVKSLQVAAKSLIASLVMAAAVWFVQIHTYNIFALLTVGMLVYFGIALPLGAIPREDLRALFYQVRNKGQRDTSYIAEDQRQQGPDQKEQLVTTG